MNVHSAPREVYVFGRVDRLGSDHVALYVDVTAGGNPVASATTYWSPFAADYSTLAQCVREELQHRIRGLILDDETVDELTRKLRNVPAFAPNTYHGD